MSRVPRCVIVDDSEQFLAVAQSYLRRDGLDVVATATSQQEALRKVEEAQPDIVLVDINLGEESGIELTRLLVERFPHLRSRVVLISTMDHDDVVDLISDTPAAGFLPKSGLSARAVGELVA
jgi:DNA-binding NarL/FixJ family response regulator